MTASSTVSPALERAPSRCLSHQGDREREARIRRSHDHDLARYGLLLSGVVLSHPELREAPAAEAIIALIRTELEAERRELLDAGLLPWTASR